jgi:hypothetical protein
MESVLENKLMTLYKEEMISFLKSHPKYFDEAVQLAISNKQPYSWRAAFLLWGTIEENDIRIQKHIESIVNCIQEKEDGHQRELLKILYKMTISEKYEGQIFNICMNLWEQLNKNPSVRMTAFKFIVKIVKRHPELSGEINFLIQDHYLESLSPGVKRSIEKIMQELIQQKQCVSRLNRPDEKQSG